MSNACRLGAGTCRETISAGTLWRLPEDLRLWLGGPALLRLALGIAQEHTVSALRPVFSLAASRFHHPWRMLALVTYAYASGIWQSRAVAEIAALDPGLLELCHGAAPSAALIRRFREHNSAPLCRCLEQVLRRVWCARHECRPASLHPLLLVQMVSDARRRVQQAEASDAGVAGPDPKLSDFKEGNSEHARTWS